MRSFFATIKHYDGPNADRNICYSFEASGWVQASYAALDLADEKGGKLIEIRER